MAKKTGERISGTTRTIGAKGTKKRDISIASAQTGNHQLPAVKKKPPVLGV
jgi:hypothetical protein